jgi:O-antigen/teichoic acid export membrane protein
LGLSYVGARVLALEGDRESERQALGAILLLTIILSSCFALFVAASAVPIDLIFHKDVRWLLISTAALAFFQPFQPVIEQCCQGLNQIHRLSVFQLMTSGCNILLLAALIWLNRLTAATALGVYLIGIGIAAVWTIFRLRPRFSGSWRFVRYTLAEIRRYGINLYLARIAGMASTRVDQLVIAYFIRETAPLAMYAVVQKFANPITMAGRSLALTRFRAFARASAVSKRIARWNTAVLLLAASGLIVAGPPLIRFFFPRYAEAAWLLFPFAIASLFTGLFQPYNIFLSSHGRGRELRNIVLIVGSISLATLFFAVPRFGIGGAAWTAAGAMALDYLLHLHYYREFKRSSSQADMRR